MQSRVHISLEVSNLDKSLDFYSKLFRVSATKIQKDYANFRLDYPQLHLALVLKPGRTPEPKDSNRHFGVELFADERLNDWFESANVNSLNPRKEEDKTCCYAVSDKFWTQDPDGHEWEFWIKKQDAEAMFDSPETKSNSVCSTSGTCC